MFKKTALIAGIGLALSASAQADYRWELGAGYSETGVDSKLTTPAGTSKKDNDADLWKIDGTWYMETVDTSKGPLGEAAFLDHASYISLGYLDGEIDLNSFDNADGESYLFDSRYVAEGPGWKLSGWLVDLGFERREPGDAEIDYYRIGIGKYVTPNTTVVVDWQGIYINNGGDTDGYGVSVDHFFAFGNGGLKVGANGGKTVVKGEDDVDKWGIDGTWYIGNYWGIGGGYGVEDQDGNEVAAWNVGVEWFITENFAVDAGYREVDPDDIRIGGDKLEVEVDGWRVGALVRF
jgi:hypothetical protein